MIVLHFYDDIQVNNLLNKAVMNSKANVKVTTAVKNNCLVNPFTAVGASRMGACEVLNQSWSCKFFKNQTVKTTTLPTTELYLITTSLSHQSDTHKDFILLILQSGTQTVFQEIRIRPFTCTQGHMT